MADVTVIYYTSNREKEDFENKIKENLLKSKSHTPLISVSQKPLDFGENICIGDVGTSDHNIYRQIQLGALKAATKFVCTAEADCLYPPTGYFDFNPPDEKAAYQYMNVWILYKGSHIFRKKAFSLCALFSNREFLLSRLDRILHKLPTWSLKKPHPLFHRYYDWTPFKNDLPVVNVKTHEGMRWYTGTEDVSATKLPYWGSVIKLEEKLWPK